MANKKIESLTEIKEAVAATSAVAETKRKPSRDKQGRSYATGKRKNAVARVWLCRVKAISPSMKSRLTHILPVRF